MNRFFHSGQSRQFQTDDPDYAIWIGEHEKIGENLPSEKPDLQMIPIGGGIFSAGAGWRASLAASVRRRVFATRHAYIMLREPDCYLSDTAFSQITSALRKHPDADLIYGDEDLLSDDRKLRRSPYFKPEWSPDLLRSFNYFGAAVVYRREVLLQALGDLENVSCADVGDFLHRLNIRCASHAHRDRIVHISAIICHITGQKLYDRWYGIRETKDVLRGDRTGVPLPKVSIVIPSKDHFDYLSRCIEAIRSKTSYPEYEIIVVDNGSTGFVQNRIRKMIGQAEGTEIRYLYAPMTFNFSKMCNIGAKAASGEYLVLLNDDVVVTQEDWLERMLASARRKRTGAVGVKLLYPDGTIQHCGVVNLPDGPRHSLHGERDDQPLAFGRNRVPSNVLSVTAACLMVKKELYDRIGGFDESLAVTYNDVDFCIRLWKQGYFNVLRGDVSLIHDESKSRGDDAADFAKLGRLNTEQQRMFRKNGMRRGEDPFYSVNLTEEKDDCSICTEPAEKRGPRFLKALPGEKKDLGLMISRVRCGEEIRITGSVRVPELHHTKPQVHVSVYVRASCERYFLAETVPLSAYCGEEIYFAAFFPERFLTRKRSGFGVLLTDENGIVFRQEAPERIEMRDYPVTAEAARIETGDSPAADEAAPVRKNSDGSSEGFTDREDVAFHFDRMDLARGILGVRGWAFITTDLHNDRYVIQIAVRGGGIVSILDVSRDERYDIQRTFSDLPNLLFSGFHRTAFLPDAIDPEDAEFWLLFTSLESGERFRFRVPK
jgi:GT2 family glycosyltransferase